MNILFVSRKFYPDVVGGGQISPLYTAKALVKKGHEVHMLTFGERLEYNIFDIKVHREPLKQIPGLKVYSGMNYMWSQMAKITDKYVEELKPDVVHLLNFESVMKTSTLLKKKYPHIPLFANVNAPSYECFTGAGLDAKGNTCLNCDSGKRLFCCMKKWGTVKGILYYLYSVHYRKLMKKSFADLTKLFPVSSAMFDMLKKTGTPESKMTIIHNPVEIHKKINTNLKKTLNLEDKKVILYAGRLAEDKGVQYIIKALDYLPNVALVVAGKGPYEKELKQLAAANKSKIKFVGFIQPEKLGEYYSITDLVVFPCTIYESLSRMLIEAASYGIPIVATDIGGNSEIVEHGTTGVLIKRIEINALAKRIWEIIYDEKVYTDFSRYAIQKMKAEFAPDKIADKLLEEYHNGITNAAR